MIQVAFEAHNLTALAEAIDDFVDEMMAAGMRTWSVSYSQAEFYHEGIRLEGWRGVFKTSFTPPDPVREARDEDIAATEAKYDDMFTRTPENFTGPDAEKIRAELAKLDGSTASAVSLLTEVPAEKLDDYGGAPVAEVQ